MSDGKPKAIRVIVSAMWVIGFMTLGKGLGLVKDVVVAAKFGTSASMDSFLVAFTIPMLIVSWFRSPMRSGFVPLFTEDLQRGNEREAWRAAGVFTGDLLVLVGVLSAIGFLFSPWIVSMVAPGFETSEHLLATSMVRIMMVTVFLSTLSGVMTDVSHCYGDFAIPSIKHPLGNLFLIIGAVFLTGRLGIRGLAWGVTAGSLASILIQVPYFWRRRALVRIGFDIRDPLFLGVLRLALPLFIGMAGAKLDDIVDRIFASHLPEGSISGLSYAMRLIDLPREITIVGFSTVLFPFFARMVASGRMDDFADRLMASLRIVFFTLFPVSVVLALLGDPFVRLLFQRGAFDERSVQFTLSALLLYTPTLWALGMTSVVISGFVAMKDTKTPVIAGFLRLGLKIGLIFALINTFQLAGIALATSISHVFKLVLFLFMLPASVRRGRYGRLFRGLGGVAAATAVMGAFIYYIGPYMLFAGPEDPIIMRVLALAAPAVAGLSVYLASAFVFSRRELLETWEVVKDAFRTLFSKAKRSVPPPVDMD